MYFARSNTSRRSHNRIYAFGDLILLFIPIHFKSGLKHNFIFAEIYRSIILSFQNFYRSRISSQRNLSQQN